MIINPEDKKHSLLSYFVKGELSKRVYDSIANAIGLFSSFLTIRFLSVFHFGLFQLTLAFISLVDALSVDFLDGIVSVDMRRFLNVKKPEFAKRLFIENAIFKVGLSLSVTLIVLVGAALIADSYGEDIATFIRVASLLFIARAIYGIESIFLKSIMSFSYWSFPAIREAVKLAAIGGFLFFSSKLSLLEIVIAHTGAEIVAVILLTIFVFWKSYRRAFGLARAVGEKVLWPIFKAYGKWAALRFGFSRISKNTMPWLIKFFINTEAVAFYSLAINLVAFIEGLVPLSGLSPIMALKADSKGELAFIFKKSVKYVTWFGVFLLLAGFFIAPPVVVWLFPNYLPAIPVFRVMLFALPIYGLYKILKITLTVLREYKTLTLRIVNETLIVPLGAVIFLPIFKILGTGVVYNLVYWERVLFFYGQLVKKFPEFKMKWRNLFKFDQADRDFFQKAISRGLGFFKKKSI